LDIIKRLGFDPEKDNLSDALKCAGWSGKEEVIKYLLEMGTNPNDKPNSGSSALDRCLDKFSFDTFRFDVYKSVIHKWQLTSHFNCLEQLAKHKARWVPDDQRSINQFRRFLFKCDPEVTIEFLKIVKTNGACSDDSIRKLLSTPKMKSHLKKNEYELNRIGLKDILGTSSSKNDKNKEIL
jgi:hypothetical protein